MMDSYISDELLVETNHEVLRHLENCPGCRGEMSDRRLLKVRLRQIVKSADETQISSIFAARMTANLRETALQPSFWERLTGGGRYLNMQAASVGFACLLVLGLGGGIWFTRSAAPVIDARTQNNNNNADLAKAVRVSWSEMTTQAVGDHENCAVEFKLKEHPISLDEASTKFGAYNKDLDKVVVAALKVVLAAYNPNIDPVIAADTRLIEAHSCLFEGRRFAHIVVKHKGRLVSFLVTDTDLPAGNDGVQTAHFDGTTNAAGVQFGHHAVFVVSQLAESENIALAKAIAPAIRLHAEKLGA